MTEINRFYLILRNSSNFLCHIRCAPGRKFAVRSHISFSRGIADDEEAGVLVRVVEARFQVLLFFTYYRG
ncbi:MAG: hypothetical protein ABF384_13555 [Verrucomicrobiales bacterium]